MAAIKSEMREPVTARTIERPNKTQLKLDHRKSFVSQVAFRFPLDNPIGTKDLALSKNNFVWLRINAKKFYGHRTVALDRCVPRDLSLCLARHDSAKLFANDLLPSSDSEIGRPNKRTSRFLRLGRYDPFEAQGSYECIEAPEVRCSSVEVDEQKPSIPERLTTAEFKAALRKCLVAAYVRDRWDGLNIDEAVEKFTKDHVEKLKGIHKERNLCKGWKKYRQPSPASGTSTGMQSPPNTATTTTTTDGVILPKLLTGRLSMCPPGNQSEWKVKYWDARVLDRMIMSGKNK